MAQRQQWFEILRLSIQQEHGKGWSIREIGATARNPVGRDQLTRIWEDRNQSLKDAHKLNIELLANPQQGGDEFTSWPKVVSRFLKSREGLRSSTMRDIRTRVERTLEALRSKTCPTQSWLKRGIYIPL